jgi:hypothetical protein
MANSFFVKSGIWFGCRKSGLGRPAFVLHNNTFFWNASGIPSTE